MSIPVNLFNRYVPGDLPGPANNRLLANLLGGNLAAPVSPQNAGDTIAATFYALDEGDFPVPFKNHRYTASLVVVRLRAQGNNTVYGYGDNNFVGSEIAPATVIAGSNYPFASRTQSGSGVQEKHRIQFASLPQTGTFKMGYGGPAIAGGGVGPQGFSRAINVADGVAGVQAALREMALVKWINEPPTPVQGDWTPFIFVTGTINDMVIEYQRGAPTGGPGIVPLPTFSTGFDVQYGFGWNISVVLTNPNYTDLFLTTNAPAYLEVLIDGAITAQVQLLSNITPGTAPSVDFSANISNTTPGTSINFHDDSANAPASWLWNFGDGITSTARNPTHAYVANGSYTVTLTATNAYGSNTATKINYIIIGTIVLPPSIGGVLYDGDHAAAWPAGELRFSRPILNDNSVLLVRQKWRQLRSQWSPLPINSSGPYVGQATYLVDETELQDLDFGVAEWDRVWATMPPHRVEKGAAVKTFKYAIKTWENGGLKDVQIVTQSKTINCNLVFDYSTDPNSLSAGTVPDISIVKLYGEFGSRVWTTGGFPFNAAVGSATDNNEFYCTIAGEIGLWMGGIYYSKRYEGST